MTVNKATLPSQLGQRLAEERNRTGMSQLAFGKIAGVGKPTQGQYESGKTVPDARYLIAIDEIGVDVFYVLFGRRLDTRSASIEHLSEAELVLVEEFREKGRVLSGSPLGSDRALTLMGRMQSLDPRDRNALMQLLKTAIRAAKLTEK